MMVEAAGNDDMYPVLDCGGGAAGWPSSPGVRVNRKAEAAWCLSPHGEAEAGGL